MVWPVDNLTTTHLDAGTDDPKQARIELFDAVSRLKTMLSDPAITEVDTQAALKALATPSMAVAVHVQGHTSRGDGGGGVFWWDSTSGADDDGGTVLIPNSSPANGRWIRLYTGAINVMWFGATGDGVTDDYAACLAAEQCAFDGQNTLEFPAGFIFAFNGRLGLRVSASGYGATLKPLDTGNTFNTLSNVHVVTSTAATDLTFSGFSIDGNANCRGIYIDGGHRCTIKDIQVSNVMASGISVFNTDDATVERCDISGVIYEPTFVAADGLYFGGCQRPRALYNRITDFRRIGIVSEGQASTKSSNIQIIGNHISNAHDCDDSSTEFNAGIWCENTNGGVIADNRVWDIGDNAGQTSNRVIGIVGTASGEDIYNTMAIIDNYVEVGTEAGNRIGKCLTVTGSSNLTRVIVRGNHFSNANVGVECGPGLKSVEIDGSLFDNLRITAGSHACVLISGDTSPAQAIRIANIAFIGLDDADASNDWTHIHVFSGAPTTLRIDNCAEIGLAMRTTGTDAYISNSRILVGTNSAYRTINTTRNAFVSRTSFSPQSGRSNTNFLVNGAGACRIQNSIIHNVTVNYAVNVGIAAKLFMWHCQIQQGAVITMDVVGSCHAKIDSNFFEEYHNTNGAIKANFSAGSLKLFIYNNDFYHTDTNNFPLKLWNNNPTISVIHSNTYNTAVMTNWTATSGANNIGGV